MKSQGQTLISDTAARLVDRRALVALANPLSSDMNVLRPSLLPGLLDALRHNLSHKNYDVALFELGRVFTQARGTGVPACRFTKPPARCSPRRTPHRPRLDRPAQSRSSGAAKSAMPNSTFMI